MRSAKAESYAPGKADQLGKGKGVPRIVCGNLFTVDGLRQ
jgi:hypothetical protein